MKALGLHMIDDAVQSKFSDAAEKMIDYRRVGALFCELHEECGEKAARKFGDFLLACLIIHPDWDEDTLMKYFFTTVLGVDIDDNEEQIFFEL